jgi:AI-2 transport protein TqsA
VFRKALAAAKLGPSLQYLMGLFLRIYRMVLGPKIILGFVAAVLFVAAATRPSTAFAPLALAIFSVAIVWQLQHRLQARMPKLPAPVITIVITVAVCLAFASLTVWGYNRVGRSLVTNARRCMTH